MRTISSLLLILSLACLGGCSKKPDTLAEEYDQKEMEIAIQQARDSFDDFKERWQNPQPGDSEFSIKVKIQDKHGTEHFWITHVEAKGDGFVGTIGDEPGIVKNVKYGQKYEFTFADVSDWLYMSNNVMQGNYTLRVILKSMPKREAEKLKKQLGW